MEYAIAAWCPYNKKDIDTLERVQRKATKIVKSLRDLTYEERLVKLGLTTLKLRWIRGDLVEYFKIERGLTIVDWHLPNIICPSLTVDGPAKGLRGSKHRIARQYSVIRQREFFLSNRVVPHWNALPESVIASGKKNVFKNKVDEFLKNNPSSFF